MYLVICKVEEILLNCLPKVNVHNFTSIWFEDSRPKIGKRKQNWNWDSTGEKRTKCEVDMLFYEVVISVDCTETKDFISYIIFQLTKLQVDLMNFTFTFYFYGFATFSSWRHNKKRYRIFRSTQSNHVYVLWHVTQNVQIRELFIMHLNNIHVHVCNALQLKLTNGAMVYIF